MAPGRPTCVDPTFLNQFLLKHQQLLYDETTKKVTSKKAAIWEQVSSELLETCGIQKSASALYAYVTCSKIFRNNEPQHDVQSVSIKIIIFLQWLILTRTRSSMDQTFRLLSCLQYYFHRNFTTQQIMITIKQST